uniref:Uncharacterized protein n=1 Tax=Stomoxys calcitrans TaxID=35570 RepID=A0A1I8QAZ8_STOCA
MEALEHTQCNSEHTTEVGTKIFKNESEEANNGQKQEEHHKQKEDADGNVLMLEFDCLKRYIQKLQLRLKTQIENCHPKDDCLHHEIAFKCSENEICTLQKNHHKLQCQINELFKCNQAAKDHIRDLKFQMIEKDKEISKLCNSVEVLLQWRDNLNHEFGKCIERFEYLKHVKAEWQSVAVKLEEQNKNFTSKMQSFVPKLNFQQEKQSFICAINEIKEMFKELFEYQLQRFDCLEKRFDSVTGGQ